MSSEAVINVIMVVDNTKIICYSKTCKNTKTCAQHYTADNKRYKEGPTPNLYYGGVRPRELMYCRQDLLTHMESKLFHSFETGAWYIHYNGGVTHDHR
jgi:hypothetical protein